MATLALPLPQRGIRLTPMQIYLLAMVAGALLTMGGLASTLLVLKAHDALPPPQFSNSLCIDEKIRSMREGMPTDPNLLVVGSSVAWRHFNSPAAIAAKPGVRPFNAGFCGAKMTEVKTITAWLTTRLPSVRHVLLIASPLDFEACTSGDPSQFNVFDADAYVFNHASPARYYARYFDPITLAGNARIVRQKRSSITAPDPLFQDRYGDAPNQPARSRGLFYGGVTPDPACFAALGETARILRRKDVTLDVTITPLHPEWVAQRGGGAFTAQLDDAIRTSLAGTDARFEPTPYRPDARAFYDAIHIRWSATAAYTRALLAETRPLGDRRVAAAR
ncbi:MAG: hypothetical protein ACTHMG_04040 [Sphingomonas sp.]